MERREEGPGRREGVKMSNWRWGPRRGSEAGKVPLLSAATAAAAATTSLCMTVDSSPAQLRGSQVAISDDDDDDGGMGEVFSGRGNGGGGNNTGGRILQLPRGTFDPQRCRSETGTGSLHRTAAGRQSFGDDETDDGEVD